ncbi:MAG: hypothetical protein ACI9S8_000967 [Chlamydiales bacterium]|jgi:hypothetical protein
MEISESNMISSNATINKMLSIPREPKEIKAKEVSVIQRMDVKGAQEFQKSKAFIGKANKVVNSFGGDSNLANSKAVTTILTDLRSKVNDLFLKAADDSPTKNALGDLQSKIGSALESSRNT